MPIQHAKSYPFFIPETSYVLDQDGWREHPGHANKDRVSKDHLHGVIASGSNASPDQLEHKFKGHEQLLKYPIYVTRGQLHDFESVYSAHFTSYGSVPATLASAIGAITDVFVTWLNDDQLARMHETESIGVNYDYVQMPNIKLRLETGDLLQSAYAYLSKRGSLSQHGKPISLKAMSQEQVLRYAKSQVTSTTKSLDDFILALIKSPQTRAKYTRRLAQKACPMTKATNTINP
ncbi:MAG: hypothetical protein JKY92_06340 [Magnetovibrio sp.]|nr:hypothetical protein [Magnetovibrio sp.]